jgi:hypothetical protein
MLGAEALSPVNLLSALRFHEAGAVLSGRAALFCIKDRISGLTLTSQTAKTSYADRVTSMIFGT